MRGAATRGLVGGGVGGSADPDYVVVPAGAFIPSPSVPFPSRTKTAVIAGGAAGDHTVAGVAASDRVQSVVRLNRDGTAATIDISDLTAEFSVTAANTINNTGGTDTTGDSLLVSYNGGFELTGMAFDDTVVEKAACTLLVPSSWPSINIGCLGVSAVFGSGTVRIESSSLSQSVDIEVAPGYGGALFANAAVTPSAPLPVNANFFSFERDADHVNDDLVGDFVVIALVLTPGA